MTVHAARRAEDGADASDARLVADGQLILDLIGHDASAEDVGELIVALGMLGAILAEEAADATGREAGDVLREIALRFAA
jgi:hypothetical protein